MPTFLPPLQHLDPRQKGRTLASRNPCLQLLDAGCQPRDLSLRLLGPGALGSHGSPTHAREACSRLIVSAVAAVVGQCVEGQRPVGQGSVAVAFVAVGHGLLLFTRCRSNRRARLAAQLTAVPPSIPKWLIA